MILNLLAKTNSLKIVVFYLLIFCHPVLAANIFNIPENKHVYSSVIEFSRSNCLPCHYNNISNGTDLSALFSHLSKPDLRNYLELILKEGDMPPEKVLREILYSKFLQIK